MTDQTKQMSEDEQFAALTAGNPLFNGEAPGEGEAADAAGQRQDDADASRQEGASDGQPSAGSEAANAQGGATAAAGGEQADAEAPGQDGEGRGAAAGSAGGEAAGTDNELFPGYSQLSPETREAIDRFAQDKRKIENDYRALHGMTAPLQRQNAELRRQHDALVARIQQLEQIDRTQRSASAAKDEALKEFDEWAKQFPEESKALLALVNPLREKVVALEGSLGAARAELGTLHAERQQAALSREIGELEKAHPDWREIYFSPDYREWLDRQTPGIQALESSMFAGDSIQLLNMFKGSRPRPPEANPGQTTSAAGGIADAVQQRRNQALKQGTQPVVRSTESAAVQAGNQPDMTDEDAMFARLVANNPLFK